LSKNAVFTPHPVFACIKNSPLYSRAFAATSSEFRNVVWYSENTKDDLTDEADKRLKNFEDKLSHFDTICRLVTNGRTDRRHDTLRSFG